MSLPSRRRWSATPAAVAVVLLGAALVGTPAQADPSRPQPVAQANGPQPAAEANGPQPAAEANGPQPAAEANRPQPAAQADRPQAAQDGPVLKFTVARNEVGLPQPAESDPPQISWGVPGDPDGGTAKDVVVKIDVSGISAFADVRGPSGCPDDVCAWPVRDIAPDDWAGGLIEMSAKPGAALGTTGTARVYATSSNAKVIDTTVKVTVGAVNLVVSRLPQTDTAEPGSTLDAPITVANTGSLTAQGVELRIGTSHELGFAQRFSNCVYGTTDLPSGNGRTLPEAVCRISTPVEPGKRYRLSTAVGFDVKKTALFEFVDYRVTPLAATVPTSAKSGNGSGPELALVPDGAAPPSGSLTEWWRWIVNAVNTADLDVTGDTVTADPGDTVTLAAKIRNDGPASVDLITTDGQISLLVNIPKGTRAVKVPERCRLWNGDGTGEPDPDAPAYLCWIGSPFPVGKVATLPFVLKVDEDAPATTRGVVRHMSEWGAELTFDTNKANNQAFFTVNVTDAAGTGGSTGGSAGGSGGNKPQTQSVANAQPNATAGGGTGALAQTGSSGTSAIAWASAAVLAAGGALVVITRRRGTRTAA
ncbi:LPXTG cell wall anchor domain-containing protein [Streptomyces scopuliridis]|uniref:LPXTG cell wall anchor domain-containing protein n=1 Tax=Streptomyces scopuliridis TaxID=452529 RepID=UPI002DD7BB20|nr:LPXTG cell wall anchor domain-containing protein [Streptomyces scopuliridis]WSB34597.1 LPXTG cell wall anchor domain-containing protein [Streptomyces scopuliridis]